jgi:hypothetical protein
MYPLPLAEQPRSGFAARLDSLHECPLLAGSGRSLERGRRVARRSPRSRCASTRFQPLELPRPLQAARVVWRQV